MYKTDNYKNNEMIIIRLPYLNNWIEMYIYIYLNIIIY
jgi:hypothetical protein